MNCKPALSQTSIPLRPRAFTPVELARWGERILEIYGRMRATSPYTVQCDDLALTVLPNVYAPRFFTDSMWFARQVAEIVEQASLLEVGTGTGIIAINCARNGAFVVATDINPDAVINAKINAREHRVLLDVRKGDVYEPLAKGERFDFVFWAHPFNNWPTPVSDMLLRSGLDYQYEGLRAYIAGARSHLKDNGRLLLGSGDSADLSTITSVAHEHGYTVKNIREVEMPLAEWGSERIRYLLLDFCKALDSACPTRSQTAFV